jgi:hypothetical protein
MQTYHRGEVRVDKDFARFGSKTYAINKINSVEIRSDLKGTNAGWVLCGIVAIVTLILIFGEPSVTKALVLAAFAGMAYYFFKESRKVIYKLYLMTSSSEAQALQSEDKDEIEELQHAIETAMTGR